MKRMRLILALLLVGLVGSGSAWADHHRGGHIDFGFYLGPPWGWPGYYYPPPGYYYPPVVAVPAAPPVYIEQGSAIAPATPAQTPANYWYYCAAAKNYYPYVKECPGGWQRVAPQPEQGR
jgi:hypothetical protein